MKELLRTGSFTKLWLAIFVSTVGNFLLMLSLSVYMYRETGLNFAAASVFGTQWMAALFSAPLGGWLTDRFRSARLAGVCEGAGGAVSLLIGVLIGWTPVVFALLFVRGLAESVGKSARVVAMKEHIPEPLLERAASLIGTATFLGISLGSLAGAVLIDHLSLTQVALLDVLSFALAAALYLSLGRTAAWQPRPDAPRFHQVLSAAVASLRRHPDLMRNFGYVILTTAFFQGFHNIARALLPITHLQMGERGVMLLQALASLSFFLGAVFVALVMQRRQAAGHAEPWWLCTGTALLMLSSVFISTPFWSLLAYAVYLFLFETSFVFCQKNMITLTPKEDLGLVSSLALSLATFGMVLVIYLGGWLSDQIGLTPTAVTLFVLLMLGVLGIELKSLQLRRYVVAAVRNGEE
ncbi:MFS transporter [Caldimonas brevitalea]|uniref:Transporter n=1 Tax=Caldimonas brevitalea TaxID=413882 RepID=A0A0G3BWM7_9BURK|nr:MFS transporter [Caldimonas brevitalea]AKJ30950.1 transporter [Caldimonas brevitalea]